MASASSKALVSRDTSNISHLSISIFKYLFILTVNLFIKLLFPSWLHSSVWVYPHRWRQCFSKFIHILEKSVFINVKIKNDKSNPRSEKYASCWDNMQGYSSTNVYISLLFLWCCMCFWLLCNSQSSPTPTKAFCSIWDYTTCLMVTFPLTTYCSKIIKNIYIFGSIKLRLEKKTNEKSICKLLF